ncbi:MAG: hypothetical protein JXR96_01995 [Deltaproteobacteria bacterium]|nr:hypothetical protein [Deltaproteobacteria bacterium]
MQADRDNAQPVDDQAEPPRFKPGLKGLGIKLAAIAAGLALLPVLAVPLVLLPLCSDVRDVELATTTRLESVRDAIRDLARRAEDLDRQHRAVADKLHIARFELGVREGLDELCNRLLPLSDKKPEQLSEDKAAKAALQSGTDPFSEAVVFIPDPPTILLSRSGKASGPLTKAMPRLAKEWSANRPSPPADRHGWQWRTLGAGPYLVGVFVPPPTVEKSSSAPIQVPETAVVSDSIQSLSQQLSLTARSLSLALPALAVLLAALAIWWLHRRMISPLEMLTRAARKTVEEPERVGPERFEHKGLLEDLASSLTRLLERMRRLGEHDATAAHVRDRIGALKLALDRASEGNLSLRVQVEPGVLEELATAINRLLDSLTERLETLHQASFHMKDAAARIEGLALQLAPLQDEPADRAGSSGGGGLLDLLGVQIEGLCRLVVDTLDEVQREAPPAFDPAMRRQIDESLQALSSGFRLLADRISELSAAADRIQALQREVEAVSTNLAVSADAESPARLDMLVDDARGLSRSTSDLVETITESLNNLARSVEQVQTVFGRTLRACQQSVSSIDAWERLRLSIERRSEILRDKASSVQPGATSLAADVRELQSNLDRLRSLRARSADTLAEVGRSSKAMAETAEEIISLIERFDTGRPIPSSLTRTLARQQVALEKAIRQLTEIAATEGIEMLSADASEILIRIQQTAEQARDRIRGGSPAPSESDG